MLDATVDHVAIAVADIGPALPLYTDALGGRFLFAGEDASRSFRWAQFVFPGGGKIELIAPIGRESFVARFLDRRGPGAHHITLKVPDIEIALADLRDRGVPVMNVSTDGAMWREAFIHPRDANGTLIQIAWSALSDEEAAAHHLSDHAGADHRHITLDDLAGNLPEIGSDQAR